ncbi:adenosylcobinamide-GDP ribazoletransferase [Ostreiculturibacter nitratireducens]|uniref:adenosylcobinamide-GDP ribazoletransferase n=1 Tax=Ostreiculturibacter nitratireducens TaxID=3075226 RepID=UPI0031B64D02
MRIRSAAFIARIACAVRCSEFPVPIPEPVPRTANAVWAFPLVGFLVGGIAGIVLCATLALGLPAPVAALLALAAQIVTTGALHEDGLADVADGFWGGQTRERRLEIMRDSRIGSYGTLALILSVGLRWQAISLLAVYDAATAFLALIVVAVTSRAVPAALLAVLPAARADGLGKVASGVAVGPVAAAIAIACGTALVTPWALVVLAVQAIGAALFARFAGLRIGGQTGDVLGASEQIGECLGLVVLVTAMA